MTKSSRKPAGSKPQKPYSDFPLFPHATRRWAKITSHGGSWYKPIGDNPIAKEFAKIRTAAGVFRKAVGFYALRHGFETIAGESLDQVAVNFIMGHVDATMAATYRERISDKRLQAVTDHVRERLFEEEESE